MKIWKKYWLVALGVVLGAAGGFLYWYYVGCTTGSCSITASPLNSTLWGAVMGGLLLSLFGSGKNKDKE